MQNIQVICVGKSSLAQYESAAAEYKKRLGAYCSFTLTELPEETIYEKSASDAVIQKALEKEAQAVLRAVPRGSMLVALCIEGKQQSSEEFAQLFQQAAQSGAPDITFVIGSSHGLAPQIKQKAALRFSMSRMTFPHGLARVMLLEQIYRAYTIIHGAKYHK